MLVSYRWLSRRGVSGALRKAQQACAPTKLLPAMRTLGENFSVSGGWPVGLQVQVTDDCGRPQNEGSVVVEFSNGDPQIAMTPLRNGRWIGGRRGNLHFGFANGGCERECARPTGRR